MNGAAIEARCETAEVFELVEAAFDPVARLVESLVERQALLSLWMRGDHGWAPMAQMVSRSALLS